MRKISLCRRLAFCAVTLLTNLLVVVTTSLADPAEAESDTAPFVRAFGALADGSWAGLFSGSNEIDPIKYATDSPEKTIFKSAQYALSSTVSGDEIWYGTAASVWCYWPYISMKMPLGLMNFETPYQGCQLTPPAGQRPQAQIYIANVDSGETIHVGPDTIADGEIFWLDAQSGIVDRSYLESMFSMPGYTYRGAGTLGDLTFFAGSNEFSIRSIKTDWLDRLDAQARALEILKFPRNFDFDQDGNIGYNRIFVFDNKKKAYLGYAEFFFDTVRRFQVIEHSDGSQGIYFFGGPDQSGSQNGTSLSAMLRWVGTMEAPLKGGMFDNGFDIVSDASFEEFGVVGDFRTFSRETGTHVVASSWYHPLGQPASMLVSNAIPESGFSRQSPAFFESFFQYTDYDPDPVAARGAKFAANEFFGGYFYFGSYHQGTSSAYDHLMEEYCEIHEIEKLCDLSGYDRADTQRHREFMTKTWRAASLFRIKEEHILASDIDMMDKVQLLYGNERDWVLSPLASSKDGPYDDYQFLLEKNRLSHAPLFGSDGFGHEGMVYTFTLVAHDEKLFLGTWNAAAGLFDMFSQSDYSAWNHRALHLFGLSIPLNPFGQAQVVENNPAYFLYQSVMEGAEDGRYDVSEASRGWLLVFEDAISPPTIFKNGFGNSCNNGVRNYAKLGDDMYLGTTSWCNLGEDAGLEYYRYVNSGL